MAAKLRLGGAKGILPDEMVWEILTWFPTKSLMRFKAVSKVWLSIILDPKFAQEHRSSFRGLLLMNHDPSLKWRQPTRDFFIANLDDALGGESSNDDAKDVNVSFQFSIPEDIRRFHATNMVNGIICFYDRNVAKLCNIATREIINLPKSRCDYKYCNYHLGFDPIQSVFKLLKICPVYEEEEQDTHYVLELFYSIRSIECEILTLGVDSSWRSINPPPNRIIPLGLCIDGVLYWMTEVSGLEKFAYPLFSFHLAGEKFQSIHKPYEYVDMDDDNELCLFQFETSLALAECYWPSDYNGRDKIMITQYREGSWTEMKNYTIHQDIRSMVVRGSLPNGNLFMYSEEGFGKGRMVYPFDETWDFDREEGMVYLFDQTRKHIQKLRLRIPASDMSLYGRLCWYEENIISLKLLTGL